VPRHARPWLQTAFRTAANVAPEYSLELITKETCSPRGRIDVVQEACPKPYHWDDIGPDSQCGACSHWKDSWGDIGHTSLAEAKAYATTLYNAMRVRGARGVAWRQCAANAGL